MIESQKETHPFPVDQRPPAVSGGMEHEEQKDPVA